MKVTKGTAHCESTSIFAVEDTVRSDARVAFCLATSPNKASLLFDAFLLVCSVRLVVGAEVDDFVLANIFSIETAEHCTRVAHVCSDKRVANRHHSDDCRTLSIGRRSVLLIECNIELQDCILQRLSSQRRRHQ